MTVTELDTMMEGVRANLRAESERLLQMSGDSNATMETLNAQKVKVDALRARLGVMEDQKAQMTAEAQAAMKKPAPAAAMSMKEARGHFFRAAINGSAMPTQMSGFEQLGSIPADNADQGNGSKLLPTQLANDLLLEPAICNPLRPYMTVTQITGLELPKLGFALEDDAYALKDGETAKELKQSADNVVFGRHKMHLIARVSESLIRATPLNIEAAVMEGLENAQAARELKALFSESPASGEEEMSFYSAKNAIKQVEGADMLDAIIAAYADLEEAYRANARVCMSYMTYASMIRTLSGSENLFGKKPEEVVGLPIVFCDRATKPIVGDFAQWHLNFDSTPWYDTGKDLEKGNRLFDCTALYDIKPRMKAAFRIAKVKPGIGG